MLQVSTGKFFKTDDCYETVHRFVVYTNYKFIGRDAIDIGIGKIFPCLNAHNSEVSKFVCELVERIEKPKDGSKPGLIVSTGGSDMIKDFLAIMSFSFQAVFTLEHESTRQIISQNVSERRVQDADADSMDFLEKYFKKSVRSCREDIEGFVQFCNKLFGAERKIYEGLIRSIRRYVSALYRSRQDLDASYTMMVASVEALAQSFDRYECRWEDYDRSAKKDIDEALCDIDSNAADKVRAAIIKREHLSAVRRFVEFSISNISGSYYRTDVDSIPRPASRSDVRLAVRNAYFLRSKYIHQLQSLPRGLQTSLDMQEIVIEEGSVYFSMTGLTRFSKFVIDNFIAKQFAVDFEEFDYLPNVLKWHIVTMAPQYWLGDIAGLTKDSVNYYLAGHLSEYASFLIEGNSVFSSPVSILDKIESLVPGLAKTSQKVPFIVLYIHYCALFSSLHERCATFVSKYQDVQDFPSIENLLLYVLFRSEPPWAFSKNINLLEGYLKNRRKSSSLSLHQVLESIIYLWLVEKYWEVDQDTALKLMSDGVENWPGNRDLRNYEALLADGADPIFWGVVLGLNCTSSSAKDLGYLE